MNLGEIVERYRVLAKSFGEPVALAGFELSAEETERLFTALDEDYHISRYLSFSLMPGREYVISGNPVSHVRIDEGIASLL